MKSTFSVIYYLKRQVVKKDGTVPVMGRITVDGSAWHSEKSENKQ